MNREPERLRFGEVGVTERVVPVLAHGLDVHSPSGEQMTNYGIVPVVNDMLSRGGWEVVYLALHPLMYCDVALRRRV